MNALIATAVEQTATGATWADAAIAWAPTDLFWFCAGGGAFLACWFHGWPFQKRKGDSK